MDNIFNGLVRVKSGIALQAASNCLEYINKKRDELREVYVQDLLDNPKHIHWYNKGYKNDWKHPLKWFRSYPVPMTRKEAEDCVDYEDANILYNYMRPIRDNVEAIFNLAGEEYMYLTPEQNKLIKRWSK